MFSHDERSLYVKRLCPGTSFYELSPGLLFLEKSEIGIRQKKNKKQGPSPRVDCLFSLSWDLFAESHAFGEKFVGIIFERRQSSVLDEWQEPYQGEYGVPPPNLGTGLQQVATR